MDPIAAAKIALERTFSIIKTIQDEKIRSAVFDAVSSLQDRLLESQKTCFDLVAVNRQLEEEARQLKKQIADHENWERKSVRYRRKQVVPGVIVYVDEQPQQPGEAPVHYCPNCFMKKTESLLQRSPKSAARYCCHNCEFEYRDDSVGGAESVRTIRSGKWLGNTPGL